MVEDLAQAREEGCVDRRSFEDVVDVGACTVELAGKPHNGVSARHGVEHLLDSMTDMNHAADGEGGLFPIAPDKKNSVEQCSAISSGHHQ